MDAHALLKNTLLDDVKACMKAGDKARLATLRLITSDIKQYEVDQRSDASDEVVLQILQTMIKKRRQSIEIYQKAERSELAEKEQSEIDVIEHYLPEMLSEADIAHHVAAAIAEVGADSPAQMGQVMGLLKSKLAGQADMGLVSKAVKAALI